MEAVRKTTRFGLGDEERLHHLLVGNQLALDCAAFLCICPVKKQNGKDTQL